MCRMRNLGWIKDTPNATHWKELVLRSNGVYCPSSPGWGAGLGAYWVHGVYFEGERDGRLGYGQWLGSGM